MKSPIPNYESDIIVLAVQNRPKCGFFRPKMTSGKVYHDHGRVVIYGGFLWLVLVNQAKTQVKPHLTIVNHSKE